jgi:hypothetical protein
MRPTVRSCHVAQGLDDEVLRHKARLELGEHLRQHGDEWADVPAPPPTSSMTISGNGTVSSTRICEAGVCQSTFTSCGHAKGKSNRRGAVVRAVLTSCSERASCGGDRRVRPRFEAQSGARHL